MAPAQPAGQPESDRAGILARALVRAGKAIGIPQKRLALMLGVSPASVTRLLQNRGIDPESKEGELALLFLRLFRSLDAILGGDATNMRKWLHAHNDHLGGTPSELILTVTGLVSVADYLDAMRGKV